LNRGASWPLVVVAPTAHGTAHRTQYPKDHAKDDQDDTDCPKDGVTPKKRRNEQADDADSDQVSLPMLGVFVSIDFIRPRLSVVCLLRQPGDFQGALHWEITDGRVLIDVQTPCERTTPPPPMPSLHWLWGPGSWLPPAAVDAQCVERQPGKEGRGSGYSTRYGRRIPHASAKCNGLSSRYRLIGGAVARLAQC
jgi:hypothetical protein